MRCSIGAKAQGDTTSAIFGQVTDATNAAIPGATIGVTNRETGLQRAGKTDQEGRFNFTQLPPGAYSVKVEADGFESQQNDNLASALGQKQEVNFRLNVAHSEQNVQVSGEAPLLNPANTNTSLHAERHGPGGYSQSRGRPHLSLAVRLWRADQYRGEQQRCRFGQQWLRQRGVQRASRRLEWLHR